MPRPPLRTPPNGRRALPRSSWQSEILSRPEHVADVAALSLLTAHAISRRTVGITTGVQLRGPEGAQRLRATSAATAELCSVSRESGQGSRQPTRLRHDIGDRGVLIERS